MRSRGWAGLGFLLAGGTMLGQQYTISTVAGGGAPVTPAPATSVGLMAPMGVATDAAGNAYFSSGNFVFRLDATGTLTQVAGNGRAGYSGDSGPATEAQLNAPRGVAVDGSGAVYIADTGNNVVRKVTPDGAIATIAGNQSAGPGYAGDNGPATSASLNSPQGVAVDAVGNLYIGDSKNFVVRMVTPGGIITPVAGNGTPGFSGDGGPAFAAQLNYPADVAVDAAGRLYIADTVNSAVRRVAGGVIVTVAGTGGVPGYYGDGLAATSAQLNSPSSVALDSAGNLYISDTVNDAIRKVAASGVISTIAGNGVPGFSGDTMAAASALLRGPWGVAADRSGDVFIADSLNNRVREIGTNGNINTVAGSGVSVSLGNGGPAALSELALPAAVATDSSGNLYIADTSGNTVRKVAPNGAITILAGNGIPGYTGDGGPAVSAQVNRPRGIALDSSGNIYIADTENHVIREITTNGNITTYAGLGIAGYEGNGGLATLAQFNFPCGLAVDSSANVYIADLGNNVVREITVSNGDIVLVAGGYNPGYSGDGGQAASAQLNSPSSVALDSSNNIYIADYYNNAIRKVTVSTGFITTVAGPGTGAAGYSGDGGAATSALLSKPWGLAIDSSGNLYIGDTANNVVRYVSSSGNISTLAGNHTGGYSGDGGAATSAQLNRPMGIALGSGNVYVADANNNVIRLLTPAGTTPALRVAVTHTGAFQPGQTSAAFSITVTNASGAGTSNGAVTVTATLSANLTLGSLSGSGWSCSGTTCSRSDGLAAGASYPAIAVTVTVASAPAAASIQVAVTGGGSAAASAEDTAAVLGAPSTPSLISPVNGAGAVSLAPELTWESTGATSYKVFFGTTSPPPQVGTTTATSLAPAGPLNAGATYYWQIVAQNAAGSTSSPVWSFTTGIAAVGLEFVPVTPCRVADTRTASGAFGGPSLAGGAKRSFAIPQSACNIPATAQAYSLNVTVVPHQALQYLTLWPTGSPEPFVSTLNSVDGEVKANAALVPAGTGGAVSVFVTDPTDVVLDIDGYFIDADFAAGSGASFYALPPCRIADTRGPAGLFGTPSLAAGQSRDFPIPEADCSIPSTASAYSLNVTAVPSASKLDYLTIWPSGEAMPFVSTLNSPSGTVVANAAIVPAGANGAISVEVTDPADVVLDTNGYFAPPGAAGALSFYPMTPCRVADTRSGPIPAAGSTTTFAVLTSPCYVPPAAVAYSLNVTVVPAGALYYLTAWPAGGAQPFVSTLNAFDGQTTANAAIVPAGVNGAIDVYVTDPTHVILDINGYFAP